MGSIVELIKVLFIISSCATWFPMATTFVDNEYSNGRIDRWTLNATNSSRTFYRYLQ